MMEFKINFAKFVVLLGAGLMSSQTVAGEEGPSLKGFQCHALDERRPEPVATGRLQWKATAASVRCASGRSQESWCRGGRHLRGLALETVNGFTQFFGNDAIRPLHKADGTQGGCRLSRPQNGQITFAFDPGLTAGELQARWDLGGRSLPGRCRPLAAEQGVQHHAASHRWQALCSLQLVNEKSLDKGCANRFPIFSTVKGIKSPPTRLDDLRLEQGNACSCQRPLKTRSCGTPPCCPANSNQSERRCTHRRHVSHFAGS